MTDQLLNKITEGYKRILGENLVGIYLHGSLALGCFTWDKSDIDFIAVVENEPAPFEKAEIIKLLLKLDADAPPKGLEMSVVPRSACERFVYPTPYYLHFSNGHKQSYIDDLEGHIAMLHGVDRDLAAHFTVIRAVGKTLFGAPISEVFGNVPPSDYLDSILSDIENAEEDILEDPVYITLNLCRIMGYLKGAGVLSKLDGGKWGLEHLPEYGDVINAALTEYSGGEKKCVAAERLRQFAANTHESIKALAFSD